MLTMIDLTQALSSGSSTAITCAASFFILMLDTQSYILVAMIAWGKMLVKPTDTGSVSLNYAT
jgi:hypothetical protein